MTDRHRLGVPEAPAPPGLDPRPTAAAGPKGSSRLRIAALALLLALLAPLTVACGDDEDRTTSGGGSGGDETLVIGAIPDQDPEQLQRLYGTVATYLGDRLGVNVEYRPVTDYAASVSLFRSGDLDMVWFGGLTGVQARLQVDGADAILQREVDERFRSVFVASADAGLEPIADVDGLSAMADRRFTFGSESSTSGRLMPQYFLDQAGVGPDDFSGPPGYSGSHDKTIELVASGSYEAGALNEAVWDERSAAGRVDGSRVVEVFRTPTYHDYHWVVRPDLEERFGEGFVDEIKDAFLSLDRSDPTQAQVLDLFTAERFIETDDGNYGQIEEIARKLGLVN